MNHYDRYLAFASKAFTSSKRIVQTHTKQKTNCITWTTKWSVAKSKTCPKSKLICPKSQIVAANPLSTVCSYPFPREIWTPHLIRRFFGSHECVIETGLHKVQLFSPKNHQCALHNFFMGQKPIKTQKYFLDLSTGWLKIKYFTGEYAISPQPVV